MNPDTVTPAEMVAGTRPAGHPLEGGTGSPVVFLHGYPLNHEMWRPQLESLSLGHHVVLIDLPGYGYAQDVPAPDTLSGFAESVHATLKEHLAGPATLVGHSFGGYILLDLYRSHPEDFEGLVLTNTRSEADTPEVREKRLATVRRLEESGQALDVEATVRSLVAPASWDTGGPVVQTARAMVRGAPTATVRNTLRALASRPDLSAVLSSIRVPTLVVWGEQDQLIPPAQTRSMVARIPGSLGEGIPGAGHLPSLEAPDLFDQALGDFLRHRPT